MTLEKLSRVEDNDILNITGRCLLKYAKYREVRKIVLSFYYFALCVRCGAFIQISFIHDNLL